MATAETSHQTEIYKFSFITHIHDTVLSSFFLLVLFPFHNRMARVTLICTVLLRASIRRFGIKTPSDSCKTLITVT
uniref:Uncharacterized protein n=1 Tax=Pararge aegeria TaxID=116150 RepID=S4NXW3_9NEOP